MGQTAYGSGFRMNARGSVIILHSVCVCVSVSHVKGTLRRVLIVAAASDGTFFKSCIKQFCRKTNR